MIEYEHASDVLKESHDIIRRLSLGHIDADRLFCLRSKGSRSRGVIARCHVLPKALQKALGLEAHYVIEVISERFDSLSHEERAKVIIHELLHIPKSFGGGFRHHDFVSRKNVENLYRIYASRKSDIV
ncbi:MAG: metallopeptidase [Candidatus Aenigmarchaeota archaeon]|nr:metallopeptidase [Candidatus Aenigmarchaeota archaeon]